jgi:hypothetical protein
MTSERRRLANLANAAKSTGPRSAQGKAASSRNAMKHGLTSGMADADEDLLHLAQGVVCGAGQGDGPRELAMALTHLRRVREAKHRCLTELEQVIALTPGAASSDQSLLASARAYGTLDGYERKARSRVNRLLMKN